MAAKSRFNWQPLAWFVGLWLLGVLSVGVVAYLIRWVLL